MSGARHRQKGDRIERELVERHSGASRFRGSGHDIDIYIYIFGRDDAPMVAEVKGRKSGAGFVTLEKWLGKYNALFLRRNNADPMILLPWSVWIRIMKRVQR
jgi:hypothetical protein